MKLKQLKRQRLVIYQDELSGENPGTPVHRAGEYEAFKLRIRRRDTDPRTGEVNFLIRDCSNRLRYLIAYCMIEQPGEISQISFWINNKVALPSGELAFAGKLLDDERASYFLMDFTENHIKKNYTFVSTNLQQY